MKRTLVALLAAAGAALATPAAAGGYLYHGYHHYNCLDTAVADDAFPMGEEPLPILVQEAVQARQGKGLSLAGFYNDPELSLAHRGAVYVMPVCGELAYDDDRGPHVIVSDYRRHYAPLRTRY